MTRLLDLVTSDLSPAVKTIIWRVLITLLLTVHVSWACGVWPGQTGFALAGDLQEMSENVSRLEQTIACNLVETEINRLRAELRSVETDIFAAEQQLNDDLIAFLQRRKSQISDEVQDQIDKRRANRCSIQA